MKHFSMVVVILVLTALVALGVYRGYQVIVSKTKPARANEVSRAVPVHTERVTAGEIAEEVVATGQVKAARDVTVFPKASGVIMRMDVKEGEDVVRIECPSPDKVEEFLSDIRRENSDEARRVIAVIEHDALDVQLEGGQAALAVADASLSQAQAQFDNVALEKERVENLFKEGSATRQALDKAISERAAAEARVKLAEAQIRQARANVSQALLALRECWVISPINGKLAEKYLEVGDTATPAKPIARITDVSTLKVVVSVSEKVYARIADRGTGNVLVSVEIDARPGVRLPCKISVLSPLIDEKTRTGKVEVEIANPDGRIAPGMFARVHFTLGRKTGVPIIPRDALVRAEEDYFAFIVEKGRAVRKLVEPGIISGNRMEVVSGLSAGDILVTRGAAALGDGVEVEIVK